MSRRASHTLRRGLPWVRIDKPCDGIVIRLQRRAPDISVLVKDERGAIFHTYEPRASS